MPSIDKAAKQTAVKTSAEATKANKKATRDAKNKPVVAANKKTSSTHKPKKR